MVGSGQVVLVRNLLVGLVVEGLVRVSNGPRPTWFRGQEERRNGSGQVDDGFVFVKLCLDKLPTAQVRPDRFNFTL